MDLFEMLTEYLTGPKRPGQFPPQEHTIVRDTKIRKQVDEEGYYVADFLSEKERGLLTELYNRYHEIKNSDGATFFSRFSKDSDYRKKMHDFIGEILAGALDKWFVNYKSISNIYAVKTSGKLSKIPVHQDPTGVDERKHSLINVWIPLQPVNSSNGALHIIPRSHHMFIPYRYLTIEPLHQNIESIIYQYFMPVYLELGQAVFFDARMFHYSAPNLSGQNRVAALCRICPTEATIITCRREKDLVELWQCPDDHLIHADGFEDNSRPEDNIRPKDGKLIESKRVNTAALTLGEFEKLRKKYRIEPKNFVNQLDSAFPNFILEAKPV